MIKEIISNGLVTKVKEIGGEFWLYKQSYMCLECCNGDRCDDSCTAKYKGRRKECPHCQGRGWIDKQRN